MHINHNNLIEVDLIKSRLQTHIIGGNIKYFDELESTNEYAKELAELGESEGTLIIADHQKTGRGRLDRKWCSPRSVNLYLSIILRPEIDVKDVNILTLISSISTVDTISDYGIKSYIKWPNDVVVNGRKISGVLTELNSRKELIEFVVVGIGININLTQEDMKQFGNLSDIATSMFIERGILIDRNKFLIEFLENIDRTYLEFHKMGKNIILEKWLARWNGLNQKVEVSLDNESFLADCKGLDEYGYLVVEKSNGDKYTVYSGDVTLIGS